MNPTTGARPGAYVPAARLCAAAIFVLPFLWPLHAKPFSTFYNEWMAAVLLIAVCAALGASLLRKQAHAFELPAVATLFLPLAAVVLLQWARGQLTYSSDAIFPLATLALATAALVCGRALEREFGVERLLVWFSVAALAGGLLNFLLQIVQVLGHSGIRMPYIPYFNSRGDYFGALGQRNQLSTYLSWGLVGVLYLFAAKRIRARWTLVLGMVFLVAMTLTRSRTAWLEIVWITLAGAAFLKLLAPAERPFRWQWLLGLPLAFAFVNLALPRLFDAFGLVYGQAALERLAAEGLDRNRILLYTQGWQLFLGQPILGIGPGQLFNHQFQLLDQVDKILFAHSTHNVVLDLMLFFGLIGALPFLALLGAWAWRTLKQPMSPGRIAAILMLGSLGIHAMLELPHWYGYFLLPAALLVGALDPRTLRLPSGRLLRVLPLALSVYGAAVAISMLFQYRVLENMHARYYSKARHTVADQRRLAEILSFRDQTWFAGPAEFILCTNFALNDIALQEKLAIAERTIRALPEPHIVYRYVLLLALDGRAEEGVKLLERTRKTFPQAYEEIVAEFEQLAARQPDVFGVLAARLKPTG